MTTTDIFAEPEVVGASGEAVEPIKKVSIINSPFLCSSLFTSQ